MAHTRPSANGKRHVGVARYGRLEQTRTFALKSQAKKWAEEQEAEWRRGIVRDRSADKMTLGEWYVIWHAGRRVAPNTAERHDRIHKKLVLPEWEDWTLGAIRRHLIRKWVADMEEAGISTAEIHLAFWALSGMLRSAFEEEPPLIPANPCRGVRLPALPPPSERFFSPAEARLILAELREPWRTMVELSLWTGLRWQELAELRGGSVDWLRRLVRVQLVRDVAGERVGAKSDTSVRWVPVPPWVIESMSALMADRDRDGRVFVNRHGGALLYNTWHWNFRRACEVAGVPYAPPHTLRHTAASWLTEAGVDDRRIQGLLGHATARQTRRYAHLKPAAHGRIRDAWDVIAAEFGGVSGERDLETGGC